MLRAARLIAVALFTLSSTPASYADDDDEECTVVWGT